MQSLLILGRQPALGVAEIESLYGGDKIRLVGHKSVIVDVDPCRLAFNRLGGSVKFCKILTVLNTIDWQEIEQYLVQVSPDHSRNLPKGKMQLGLSVIGFEISSQKLQASGLTIKKAIKHTGRNVRLVPNKSPELSSAQVHHNHLTGSTGWELIFIRDGQTTIIGQTVKVQDFAAYTRRDRLRPKRDAKVGMLPPKLAQIIINLAAGKLAEDKLESICDTPADQEIARPDLGQTVLDPFCGTGVILQEAYLMGYEIYGTDIDKRMVAFTQENLHWLSADLNARINDDRIMNADASSYHWPAEFDFIASETYLGRPFTAPPTPEILAQTMSDCNIILKKFLQNIYSQTGSGTRLCLAVPAWQIKPRQFKHLTFVDQISDLGYNQVSFEHAAADQLIYYRQNQIVARQLLIITRK